MCLAVPGKIIKIENKNKATVDFMGTRRTVFIDLIEDARINEYVIVHAGFAINKLNEKEAKEAISIFKKFEEESS